MIDPCNRPPVRTQPSKSFYPDNPEFCRSRYNFHVNWGNLLPSAIFYKYSSYRLSFARSLKNIRHEICNFIINNNSYVEDTDTVQIIRHKDADVHDCDFIRKKGYQ